MDLSPWLLVLLIFVARIGDVSLGTIRTIMVFRGLWLVAGVIGFFEILIWLVAASKVLQNLDHWYLAVSYAAGFAAGNIVGIWLESKLAIGTALLRTISEDLDVHLADHLRAEGYHVTEIPGFERDKKPIEILLIVESRKRIGPLIERIHSLDPNAVCTTSDVKRQESLISRPGFGWRARAKKK